MQANDEDDDMDDEIQSEDSDEDIDEDATTKHLMLEGVRLNAKRNSGDLNQNKLFPEKNNRKIRGSQHNSLGDDHNFADMAEINLV